MVIIMKFIFDLILMGISSAIMYIAAQVLYRNMQKKNARWYYAMLVTSMLILILPLQWLFNIPKMMEVSVPEEIITTAPVKIPVGITVSGLVIAIWLAVAVVSAIRVIIKHLKTRRALTALSESTYNEDILRAYNEVSERIGIHRRIDVRTSCELSSPLMFGIIKPVVVIPYKDFSYSELVMIMSHELMHYRHKDLLIKFISSISVCIHWFNPVAYLLSKSLNSACELCCDESVLGMLELKDKKEYGRLIISVIESSLDKRLSYTTAMASTESGIKRRLRKIAQFSRPSMAMQIVSVMLVVSVFVTSLTAFGVDFVKTVLPDNAVEIIEKIEDTPIIDSVPTFAPTPAPTQEVRQEQGNTHSNAVIPDAIQQPAAVETVEPTATPRPGQAVTEPTKAPSEPERNSSVNIEINDSVNFDGEHITNNNKKQIEANAADKIKDGETVKAYIRVNNDGSYDLMHID